MPERREERSEEVREILGREPTWPLRWGSGLILFLLMALLFFSWTVHYPEVAEGEMVLSGDPPPVRAIDPRSGELGKIWKEHGERVQEGERLLFIGTKEAWEDLKQMERLVDELRKGLEQGGNTPSLPRMELNETEALEAPYERVEQALLDLQEAELRGPEGIQGLKSRIRLSRELLQTRKLRRELAARVLEREREAHEKDRALTERGAMARSELRQAEQELLQRKGTLEELRVGELQEELRLNELRAERERRIENAEEELRREKKELRSALNALERRIELEKSSRSVRAPVDGRVSHLRALHPGMRLEAGSSVLAVIPPDAKRIARVTIPTEGAAGVKKGKEVRLLLDEYPEEEFGSLKGKVSGRSELPSDGELQVQVELTKGLKTSHGERIRPEARLTGKAEIVTHKEPLLHRIFAP